MDWKGNIGDDSIRIHSAWLQAPTSDTGFYYVGDETHLNIECEILKGHPDLIMGFSILNGRNQQIARSRVCDREEYGSLLTSQGKHRLSFHLDMRLFHP